MCILDVEDWIIAGLFLDQREIEIHRGVVAAEEQHEARRVRTHFLDHIGERHEVA
ncbi:hypothetical protein D3C81_2239850 [compost metagenome]